MQILIKLMRDPYKEFDSEMTWINDGRSVPVDEGRHMEYARLLLDSVKPGPSQDETVRQWYIATSAHGLSCGRAAYIEKHLKHAQDAFPSDAMILFLSGLLHEEYAAPRYQSALGPSGTNLRPVSRQKELELAHKFFQRATTADPNFAEARLRLGRITGLLGDHRKAVVEIEKAYATLTDPPLKYYAALFLGREKTMLGRKAEALVQFRRAAEMYPDAQSPLLAESQLAHSLGDIANASKAMESIFAVAAHGARQGDP